MSEGVCVQVPHNPINVIFARNLSIIRLVMQDRTFSIMRCKDTKNYQDQETLLYKYDKDYIIKDLYMTKREGFLNYLSRPHIILSEDFQSLCFILAVKATLK